MEDAKPGQVEVAGVVPSGGQGWVKAKGTVEDDWVRPDEETPACPGCQTYLTTGSPAVEEGETDALHRVYLRGKVFRLGRGDSGKLQDELVFLFELSFQAGDALLQL